MRLALDIQHRAGPFSLDVKLECAGPVTAIFGPSGAGKTTLLNILAGLVRPTQGRISVDDRVWLDTARGVCLAPHERAIGYVFQEGRLFPHLSVRHNLTYGEAFAKDRAPVATFDEVVSLLGLAPLLARRTRNLSGGEQQRVAIGRALLARPRLMLMDEPLASLDAARRAEILPYLDSLRARFAIPTLYVSHSAEEVERLADEVATMEAGVITGLRRLTPQV
jgi:molybdate transport system ATP-binding protein